jgi:hypothetical protein
MERGYAYNFGALCASVEASARVIERELDCAKKELGRLREALLESRCRVSLDPPACETCRLDPTICDGKPSVGVDDAAVQLGEEVAGE